MPPENRFEEYEIKGLVSELWGYAERFYHDFSKNPENIPDLQNLRDAVMRQTAANILNKPEIQSKMVQALQSETPPDGDALKFLEALRKNRDARLAGFGWPWDEDELLQEALSPDFHIDSFIADAYRIITLTSWNAPPGKNAEDVTRDVDAYRKEFDAYIDALIDKGQPMDRTRIVQQQVRQIVSERRSGRHSGSP